MFLIYKKKKVIDIKIAVGISDLSSDLERLFHEKAGVFTDFEGHSVAFEGSMNETISGLASDGNIEAVNVYVDWLDDREKQRVDRIKSDFEALWSGNAPRVKIYNFPDQTKEILKKYAKNCDWEKIVDSIIERDIIADSWKPSKSSGRKPREHQLKALEAWMVSSRMGILEHATGSGKTFTALCAIKRSLDNNEVPLVLVPSRELLHQWDKEIQETFCDQNVRTLLCGDGYTSWKKDGLLSAFSSKSVSKKKIIVATMDTASTEEFIRGLNKNANLLLVADEVHRLGSPKRSSVFRISAKAKLGLSATPKRYGDPIGTQKILEYFGGIIEPPFTLEDAIKAGVLTEYFYYPKTIMLEKEEQEEWDRVSLQISLEIAKLLSNDENANIFEDKKIKNYLLKRAKIIKNANAKISLAINIIKNNYKRGQKWIVYCDNKKQLTKVLEGINSIKNIPGLMAYEYHADMEGDRTETLSFFQTYGGILVSIKCLDEGVDIPSTTHALILASSQNPREFFQRRGRVLRTADDCGKNFAYLYDAIVIPNKSELDTGKSISIINSEISRAIQFGEWALNKNVCTYQLKKISIQYNIHIEIDAQGGLESDDDED